MVENFLIWLFNEIKLYYDIFKFILFFSSKVDYN